MKSDEWLQAFRKVKRFRSDRGMTFLELMEATGIPDTALHDNLRALDRAGKLKVGWRQSRTVTKRRYQVPVYQLVEGK